MKQVKMLNKAMKDGYVVPAFNFANFEILKGLIEANVNNNGATKELLNSLSEYALEESTNELNKTLLTMQDQSEDSNTENEENK